MTVVVVGSGREIGRACAIRFARDGLDVVAVDQVAEDNEATCAAVRAAGGQALGIAVDPADTVDMEAVASQCRVLGLRVTALVNCHMDVEWASFEDTPMVAWERVVRHNLLGPVVCTRALLPLLMGYVALVAICFGRRAVDQSWRRCAFQAAALTSLTVAMVHALFDFNFFIPANPATLAALLGAAVSARDLSR